jgi:uncharacterized protein (TIGR02099 family)
LAATLIGLAILLTLVRLTLPLLAQHREGVAEFVSTTLGQQVEIGGLSAELVGFTPYFRLTDLRLLDATGGQILTVFRDASLSLDLTASLWRGTIVPGKLAVSGIELALRREADGTVSIAGVSGNGSPGSKEGLGVQGGKGGGGGGGAQKVQASSRTRNALAYWLLKQRDLEVGSARITWTDSQALLKPLVFSDVHLNIHNEDGDGDEQAVLRLYGFTRLPTGIGESFEFALEIHGDPLTVDWHGDLQVTGRKIEPALILNMERLMGLDLVGGRTDFRVVSHWEQARLTVAGGEFAAVDLEIGVPNQRFKLHRAAGRIAARRVDNNDWSIAVEDLEVSSTHGAWPKSRIAVAVTRNTAGDLDGLVANAGFVRIDDLAPIVPYIRAIPSDLRLIAQKIVPEGVLTDVRVGYHPLRPVGDRFAFSMGFSGITTQPIGLFPGLQGIEGRIRAHGQGGELELTGREAGLDLTPILGGKVAFSRLGGRLLWRQDPDLSWSWDLDTLLAESAALSATANAHLHWRHGASPVIDLAVGIGRADLAGISRLLPLAMPASGRAWLEKALVKGEVESGVVVMRGPLDHFPFAEGEGNFSARMFIKDTQAHFSDDWPDFVGLHGEVDFVGRAATAHLDAGTLGQTHIHDARAEIPDLFASERVLAIDSLTVAPASDFLDLVRATPLKETKLSRLLPLDIHGDLRLELGLSIPLYQGPEIGIDGTLHFTGNRIRERASGLEIEALRGPVRIVNDKWRGERLDAQFLGAAVKVSLGNDTHDPRFETRIRLQGRHDAREMQAAMKELFPGLLAWLKEHRLMERLQGRLAFETDLLLPEVERVNEPWLIEIRSDLKGLRLDLPAPLGKSAEEPRPTRLITHLGDKGPREVELIHGEVLAARLAIAGEKDGGGFQGARVRFGGGEPATLGKLRGIELSGNLANLSLGDWLEILAAPGAGGGTTKRLPVGIMLSLPGLRLANQRFPDLRLDGQWNDSGLRLALRGSRLAGTLSAYADPSAGPVELRLDRLRLQEDKEDLPPFPIDPRRLPPLSVQCADFSYGDANLGQMTLNTTPSGSGLHIDALRFLGAGFGVDASGDWRARDQGDDVALHMDIKGNSLQGILAGFGFQSAAIEGGATEVGIDTRWPGGPGQFGIERVRGKVRLEVKKGRLLNVEPGEGRIFSLMSLQMLPRRLFLDFKDLFSKGFSFDEITGTFTIDGGNAYTDGLRMFGSAARIVIVGRTGLKEGIYDQVATVTPQLSGTIPVAGALIGANVLEVGAVILTGQKGVSLSDRIDSLLSQQYSITGPLRDPVIAPIEKGAKKK